MLSHNDAENLVQSPMGTIESDATVLSGNIYADPMVITISKLDSGDVPAVDRLMKLYSETLGFLPEIALREHVERGGCLGAKGEDDQLIGYLLYATYRDYIRIVHLCVSEGFRGQGIARALVEELRKGAITQKMLSLHCRRDFAAHEVWPKLGFVAVGERPGRSRSGVPLTRWCLTLALDEQLSLFQARLSNDALDVVIDAQIFFDFDEPDSDKAKPSKALLSDFLVDSLRLWITDELFNEIERNDAPEQREISRLKAQGYSQVAPPPDRITDFDRALREVLPSGRPSRESDIRQLAKTAASDIRTFITRDRALLNKAEQIGSLTGLRVPSPTDLIVQLHKLLDGESYRPKRISGIGLRWKRLTASDRMSLSLESFLDHGERKGRLRETLDSLIATPDDRTCELLLSGDDVVALRVIAKGRNGTLTAYLARVARPHDPELFGRFLIADIVTTAVKYNFDIVTVQQGAFSSRLTPDLLEMGFSPHNDGLVRYCFSGCLDRHKAISAIAKLSPGSALEYQNKTDLELEACCAPLHVTTANQSYFLVPIRPVYAMSLFDQDQAASDLFGGNVNVLLRWENVYYRKNTHHHMLKPPARILWYVSRPKRQVVAVSRLDGVHIDTPKALLSQFKRFGILEWRDLYDMCERDSSRRIMALNFSRTFPFREPISLDSLKSAFAEAGCGLVLQSPSRVPANIFTEIMRLGYQEQL